jgi:hypothetical protein
MMVKERQTNQAHMLLQLQYILTGPEPTTWPELLTGVLACITSVALALKIIAGKIADGIQG